MKKAEDNLNNFEVSSRSTAKVVSLFILFVKEKQWGLHILILIINSLTNLKITSLPITDERSKFKKKSSWDGLQNILSYLALSIGNQENSSTSKFLKLFLNLTDSTGWSILVGIAG